MIGNKHGRYTVNKLIIVKNKGIHYECICECGNIRIVAKSNLLSGNSNSCGCLRKEMMKNSFTTHGDSKSLLYNVWSAMKKRCDNKKDEAYHNYGGRGIKVCDEWSYSYASFQVWSIQNGYKKGLTIERKNNDGNYSPENCMWVTRKVQNANKRDNHYITYKGETLALYIMAEKYNINGRTLWKRIDMGWDVEKALITPIRKMNGRIYSNVQQA